VPERLDDEQFAALMREPDAFKLAIRGQMAIEADIDAAIAETFGGDVPGEVRSARFGIRLALAVGLGLIPHDWKGIFEKLASLRNRFAHGEIEDLTPQRARSLRHEVRAVFGGEDAAEWVAETEQTLAGLPPQRTLVWALMTARTIIVRMTDLERRRREQEQRIITVHRALNRRRSPLLESLMQEEEPPEAADP
jgi:hypothetical protein